MTVFQGLGDATPAHTSYSEITAHEAAILHMNVQLIVNVAQNPTADKTSTD